jgi:hypothetical protein
MVKRTAKTLATMPAIVSKPQPVAVMDNTSKIIDAIIRAAGDPNIDVVKMERLEAMRDRMVAQAAKVAFDDAFAKMQPELPIVSRRGRIEIRRKDPKTGERTGVVEQSTDYALWEDINEAITPILHKHGFSLSFRTPADPAGKISVTAILARGGHREETTLPFQHDTTGSKNAAQAIVSATSYGKRVTACLLLNITTKGEDDDGKKTEELEPISQAQLAELIKLADDAGADKARFCAMMKVDSFAAITKLRFKEAKEQLLRKLKDKKARAAEAAKAKSTSDFPGDRPLER